jgi:Tol biopolymer transport system component/predicted Ser/Thr protein kinase
MIGKTFGHYQTIEKLGEGGMGVVYKARDTHLDRFVAIKVLPAEKVADPERKRRFVQEAKSASALNHPNIVTIYDIDQSSGVDFIAMEYVDGKTLDQLIPRKGMRLNEVLKYAVQIADALAAAHPAGIVHRDLKPANVMVTEKGLVKVLDFGLAKLTEPVGSDETRTTETLEPHTEEGTIVGTVAYMSPEQAEGKKVDARSDIFSLGSVLYEMVTGQKAFRGTSKMSTLAAILHQEPKPASEVGQAIPADLEKLIGRCLRKDPERRIQHMDDVKLTLLELKEDSDSGRLQAAPAAAKQAKPLRLVIGATTVVALIAIAVAGWYWLSRQRSAEVETPLKAIPLTSYAGYETIPSFSPDGNFVAFEWCGEAPGANCDIYVKQIGFEPPSQLTHDPAVEFSPAWSPDGLFIAFLRQLSPDKSAVVVVPRTGGQERVLGESDVAQTDPFTVVTYLAWTPDLKWLVIPAAESDKAGRGLSLLSVATLEKKRLTTSPAGFYESTPALSPDGQTLVFMRSGSSASDIYLLRLGVNYEPQGSPQRVFEAGAEEPFLWNAAWTSDGSEIVFSSGSHGSGSLWRMGASASAKPRRLAVTAEDVGPLAVSHKGDRLAYTLCQHKMSIWRVDLSGPVRTPGTPFLLRGSTRNDEGPACSPDGERIAFQSDSSGHVEIWVCDRDGSNAVPLTSIGAIAWAPKWSPDGRSIAFVGIVEGSEDIYVVSANGGSPRRMTTDPAVDTWPSWSRDGRWIYFKSARSGTGEIWKMPAAGGDAVQITRNDGDRPLESPDGRYLYYIKGDRYPEQCSGWKMPAGGGEETRVLDSVYCDGFWDVGEQGIYYFAKPDAKGRSEIRLHEFATGETRKLLMLDLRYRYVGVTASPDGRTILYSQYDQAGSDLMLVENFR